jgi:hypothetical protein
MDSAIRTASRVLESGDVEPSTFFAGWSECSLRELAKSISELAGKPMHYSSMVERIYPGFPGAHSREETACGRGVEFSKIERHTGDTSLVTCGQCLRSKHYKGVVAK